MSTFTPSPLQQAIFDAISNPVGGSLRIDAVAGSGKTTTVVQAVERMKGRVAFCAYNASIAKEIAARLGNRPGVQAKTFHAFGGGAWVRAANLTWQLPHNNPDKLKLLMAQTEMPYEFQSFAAKLVSLAKGHAFGVTTSAEDDNAWRHLVDHFDLSETLASQPGAMSDFGLQDLVGEGIHYARQLFQASVKADFECFDFDDMIHAPLIHNVKVPQYDWVVIDEAQDTNPARRALAKKMLAPGGRLVAVGDPHQAIYGFTGADHDALDLIQREFNATMLPLDVTYRCPKSVVVVAQQWVSHIKAHAAAPQGTVDTLTKGNFQLVTPRAEDAVLCRNTKPLVELAYGYIKRGVGCHVEGRDIGKGLEALATRWRIRSCTKLAEKLESYKGREITRLMAAGKEQLAASVEDKVDTLLVMIQGLPGGSTVEDLKAQINKLFQDGGNTLTLATVHKSKGREWDVVYLYGRNAYMPSKYARQAWQVGQERNLMYVAVTRAKQKLVEVTV
jgi:DNA helicase-2/ATP-dependent DNA helicase PcrA